MILKGMKGASMQLSTWPLEKRYAAALFYLDQVPSSAINEAQYNRLHALVLQIAYGSFVASGRLPEFSQCSASDRRKRESEWKQVQNLQKIPAMKQFLDLMSEVYPNWHKHRRIYEEFEAIWADSRPSALSKPPSKELRHASTVYDRLSSRHSKPSFRPAQVRTTALSDLQQYEDRRFLTLSPRLPKLSAPLDAAYTLNSLKASESPREVHDLHSESRYYRLSSPQPIKAEEDFAQAKSVLETYFGSMNSREASIVGRKPGFEIRSDVEKALNPLLQRLEAVKVAPVPRAQGKFPVVAARKLDVLLRPKLEIMTMVAGFLGELMPQGKGKDLLSLISAEFTEAIDSIFDYLSDLETSMKEVGQQAAFSDKQLQTAVFTLKSIQELYSIDNEKYAFFNDTKHSKDHYEMEATEGLAALAPESQAKLRDLEVVLRSQKAVYFDLESKFAYLQVERDKLVDEIRLIQQGAYADNILIGNMAKDLKRSVGIIKGGEGRGVSQELALKKELFEVKSELRDLQQEFEHLKRGESGLSSR